MDLTVMGMSCTQFMLCVQGVCSSLQTASLDGILKNAFLAPVNEQVASFFYPGTVSCLASCS